MSSDLFTPAPGDAPKIAETSLVFCGQCAHHDLEGSNMQHQGYGHCLAIAAHVRKARYLAEENRCVTGKFTPKQPPKGT